MSLTLGPIPDRLRTILAERIEECRRSGSRLVDSRIEGVLVYGGPVFCCWLDADGVIRVWDLWDETVDVLDDGPAKVGIVAIVAEHWPELAEWLPRRPDDAMSVSCAKVEAGSFHRSRQCSAPTAPESDGCCRRLPLASDTLRGIGK